MKTVSSKFLAMAFGFIFYSVILFLIFEALTLKLPAQTNAPASGTDNTVLTAPVVSPAATNVIQASNTFASDEASPKTPAGTSESVRTGHRGMGFGTTLVAVLTAFVLPVTIVVVLPVAIIAILVYSAHRRNKLLHENLRAMIDKGMPVTPELVESMKGKLPGASKPFNRYVRARLLPGLLLTGVGAALMINGHSFGGPGLIVLFIGVAFLIVWLVERMDRNNSQPPMP